MKKSQQIKVEVYCNGIQYVCTNGYGLPVTPSENAKQKVRDILAAHLFQIATEIQKELQSDTTIFTPDFYRMGNN